MLFIPIVIVKGKQISNQHRIQDGSYLRQGKQGQGMDETALLEVGDRQDLNLGVEGGGKYKYY